MTEILYRSKIINRELKITRSAKKYFFTLKASFVLAIENRKIIDKLIINENSIRNDLLLNENIFFNIILTEKANISFDENLCIICCDNQISDDLNCECKKQTTCADCLQKMGLCGVCRYVFNPITARANRYINLNDYNNNFQTINHINDDSDDSDDEFSIALDNIINNSNINHNYRLNEYNRIDNLYINDPIRREYYLQSIIEPYNSNIFIDIHQFKQQLNDIDGIENKLIFLSSKLRDNFVNIFELYIFIDKIIELRDNETGFYFRNYDNHNAFMINFQTNNRHIKELIIKRKEFFHRIYLKINQNN